MTASFQQTTDLKELQKVWSALSPAPSTTIYGDWMFRYTFYKYTNFPILGIIAYVADQPVGLLALQHNTTKGYWEFFGGSYMEDNSVLVAPGYENLIPDFFAHVPSPAKLYSIVGTHPFVTQLPIETDKYILPLSGLTSVEDYLTKFLDAEARGKFRRKLRKVEREELSVKSGHIEAMDTMIKFNRQQFGDHSAFNARPHLTEIFKDLTKQNWPIYLFEFFKGETPVAASFALVYNGVYEYFNLGTDPQTEHDNLRDLATFVHAHNITNAIAAGCHTFDAFTRSYGWKEHWRLQKIPQHEFIKP